MEVTERLVSVQSSDLSNFLLLRHYFVVLNVVITPKKIIYRGKTRKKEVE